MTPGSPPLDLLVVGGLTIDRFSDGSSAAGGSVLHIARAAASRGIRIGVVTVAGPEPEAQAGLLELRHLAASLDWTDADRTLTFTHHEDATGRHLRLEATGGRVQLDPEAVSRARTVLVAPLADEVGVDQVARLGRERPLGAILQGFLRSVADDGAVRPLPLSALDSALVEALSRFDLLVASREDLAAEGSNPPDQLAALRRVVGHRPELLITDGPEGVWSEREHLPVPRRISGVSTVGAGDILAAFVTASSAAPAPSFATRVQDAMRIVAEVLEARRQS
jgi:sugar/nucleoside kinase (ribokinase family)